MVTRRIPCQKYSSEIDNICRIIHEYGTSVNNWKVDCLLGFGAKYHCSFLSFFLHLDNCQFAYFTDNLTTPEQIAELFKDWKDIDLYAVIEKPKTVTL